MSLADLVNHFAAISEVPVEVPEVRDVMINVLRVQDEIIFCQEEMNPDELRGAYYQFTRRNNVYAEPILCSIIVYCSKLSRAWQRVICCKELVHILDRNIEKTNTKEAIEGLVTRLLGPLSTEDFGIMDIMASKDRLAIYVALGVLFPQTARTNAKIAIASGAESIDTIAEKADLPGALVRLALMPEWDGLLEELTSL
jgi:hypothetical protein